MLLVHVSAANYSEKHYRYSASLSFHRHHNVTASTGPLLLATLLFTLNQTPVRINRHYHNLYFWPKQITLSVFISFINTEVEILVLYSKSWQNYPENIIDSALFPWIVDERNVVNNYRPLISIVGDILYSVTVPFVVSGVPHQWNVSWNVHYTSLWLGRALRSRK
jgi:hypothetical protein